MFKKTGTLPVENVEATAQVGHVFSLIQYRALRLSLCRMCALAPDTLGARSRSNGSGSSNDCSKTDPGAKFHDYEKE